jgi:beta-galactosidase/beta-glucuronidase
VKVLDGTALYQLLGKQRRRPGGIFYTRVSGIWQTVWLEQVPATYIERIKIDTEIAPASIKVATTAAGDAARATTVRITASFDGKQVAEATGKLDQTTVTIADAKLWSPSDPNLYDLTVALLADGKVVDSVDSYAGIRKVGRRQDAKGHWRFTLNDQEIFHLGPLDQGWWPDGLLTPPSDEAMRFDIQYLKDAGFNMIRSHIKVRPRRYYYHCDKLGMMMWQDQVSGMPGPGWTRMRPNPKAGEWPEAAHQQYNRQLPRHSAPYSLQSL